MDQDINELLSNFNKNIIINDNNIESIKDEDIEFDDLRTELDRFQVNKNDESIKYNENSPKENVIISRYKNLMHKKISLIEKIENIKDEEILDLILLILLKIK